MGFKGGQRQHHAANIFATAVGEKAQSDIGNLACSLSRSRVMVV